MSSSASRVDRPRRGQRLFASPNFVLAFAMDGRPYVAKDVEPYTQFWLSETERVLHSLFSAPSGATVNAALEAYHRLTGKPVTATRRARLERAIGGMVEAGVLATADQDTSRYDAAMAPAYLAHRPIAQEVVDHIRLACDLEPESRVLDLAGGPGNLALRLAEGGSDVTLMDLSRGFVAAAAEEASRRGLRLTALHESCNRLAGHDETYDVITISQALHWLDHVAVCRGVCRTLDAGGSFFVIHCSLDLADDHPLAYVLGDHSALGAKSRIPFTTQVTALDRRLTLLFEALDAPGVDRIDPAGPQVVRHGLDQIAPAGVWLHRQKRPIDQGFARAFLTPDHIAGLGVPADEFWADLERRCDQARPDQLDGHQDWAVLHYCRRSPEAVGVGLAVA